MELRQCLNQLSDDALQRLAGQYEVNTQNETLTEQLGQILVSRARDSLLSSLKDEHLWALKLICLCRQGKGLVVEQCHQKLNQTTRQWRRNAGRVVQLLMDYGLVYTKRLNYRQVYIVPDPLREIIIPKLTQGIWQNCSRTCPQPEPSDADGLRAVRLLYLFLSYLDKHPVKLTQSGGMFKRAQRDILTYLGIKESLPEEGPVPVKYPPTVALLYYYCRSRRLVDNHQGRLVPARALEPWLAITPQEKVLDLYAFWQEAYLQQDSDLETLYGLLRLAPPDALLRVNALLREMETFSLGQIWQGLGARADRFCFTPLRLLGMLEMTETGGEQMCRLNDFGRHLQLHAPTESTFFVQPNYELLVPKNLHPDLLWKLETFADLQHPDQLMVYRVSKRSIYRALNSGMTIEDIIDFLKKGAKHAPPKNIMSLLDEWGSTYGKLELLDVLVLNCEDEQLAREIQASERLAPFIEGQLTKRHLLIRRQQQEEFLDALTDEGYMPKS